MLQTFKENLPEGVTIVSASFLPNKKIYKVELSYKNVTALACFPNVCEPRKQVDTVKLSIAKALSDIAITEGNFSEAERWLKWAVTKDRSKNMSVCALKGSALRCIYENIDDVEDAYLLAQFAMENKQDFRDLICILPGINVGIKNNAELYRRAKDLAEEFLSEE